MNRHFWLMFAVLLAGVWFVFTIVKPAADSTGNLFEPQAAAVVVA